jgi:hypothetical protein
MEGMSVSATSYGGEPDIPAARTRERARASRADLLAFDPYSPIFPTRAPESKDSDPLTFDPYSPVVPARC